MSGWQISHFPKFSMTSSALFAASAWPFGPRMSFFGAGRSMRNPDGGRAVFRPMTIRVAKSESCKLPSDVASRRLCLRCMTAAERITPTTC